MTHEIIVGNVGSVYSGGDDAQAKSNFRAYRLQSKAAYGRAGLEPVTWFRNEEVYMEYNPPQEEDLFLVDEKLDTDTVWGVYRRSKTSKTVRWWLIERGTDHSKMIWAARFYMADKPRYQYSVRGALWPSLLLHIWP